MLTIAWTRRVWGVQGEAPAVGVGRVLGGVVEGIGRGGDAGRKGKEREREVVVVDFCSGAGGPVETIERVLNSSRLKQGLKPLTFLLTDLHPHPVAWKAAAARSRARGTGGLGWVGGSVDATNTSVEGMRDWRVEGVGSGRAGGRVGKDADDEEVGEGSVVVERRGGGDGNGDGNGLETEGLRYRSKPQSQPQPQPTTYAAAAALPPSHNYDQSPSTSKHLTASAADNNNNNDNHHSDEDQDDNEKRYFRTFFLAFHHFDEEGAERVLRDVMENGDGIGIFELQKFNFTSLLTITGLWPLTLLFTPFLRPSLLTLFWTYIVPIVPFILVLDGYTSAYRTRSFEHIRYLAHRAHLSLEREGKTPKGGKPWVWEEGERMHTWMTGGRMGWVVGRRGDLDD